MKSLPRSAGEIARPIILLPPYIKISAAHINSSGDYMGTSGSKISFKEAEGYLNEPDVI
jgi:hypothetical protein